MGSLVRIFVICFLALFLLIPLTTADPPDPDLRATSPTLSQAIAPGGNATASVYIALDCFTVIRTGGGEATLAFAGSPAWVTLTGASVVFDAQDCISGVTESLNLTSVIQVRVDDAAPAFLPARSNVTVTYTGAVGDPITTTATVSGITAQYVPGHRTTPEGDQTFNVKGSQVFSFEMTIEITANGRTMVMFEDKKVSDPDAILNGLKAQIYDVPNGDTGETRKVTFTPPQDAWEKVTVDFRTYSHCLDGPDCDPELERTVAWTFVNEQPAVLESSAASKGAPAPQGVLVALVFAALAGIVRARR